MARKRPTRTGREPARPGRAQKQRNRRDPTITYLTPTVAESVSTALWSGLRKAASRRDVQEIIEAQNKALLELSTPIIPVLEGVIVMPLIGSIDTVQARGIMRRLLAGIREPRTRVVTLNGTGVPVIDSSVADHLKSHPGSSPEGGTVDRHGDLRRGSRDDRRPGHRLERGRDPKRPAERVASCPGRQQKRLSQTSSRAPEQGTAGPKNSDGGVP